VAKELPGKPDVVLPRYRTVIFVHGCFWHRHPGCARATSPRANADFWQQKFRRNVARDVSNVNALARLRWNVVTVWECETKDPESLKERLQVSLASNLLRVVRFGAGVRNN
jgi:DNA mismatch endonuclease (patch repair protein)